MTSLADVKEVAVFRDAEEVNDALRQGWKLLEIATGKRKVYHVPRDAEDAAYDFEVAFTLFVVGKVNGKETV